MIRVVIKGLVFVALVLSVFSCTSGERTVRICISTDAERYHYDKNCEGFNRCTHERREVPLSEAKSMGYTRCRME
jgi:hypothetical protein